MRSGVTDPAAVGTLGVLVAGGRGRRLGLGVPKALARYRGRTFLERALDALGGVCERVVVAVPRGFALPLGGAERVEDWDGGGPLGGLLAGLSVAPFARALALGVDYPAIDARVLRRLLDAFERERAGRPDLAALVPVVDGRPQPLAAVYAPAALAPLAAYFRSGERGLLGGLEPLAVARPDVRALAQGDARDAQAFAAALANVNEPDDLARLAAERVS
jgi:molybdopterin-guanine dinucleotide biosynthesis protein A